MFRFFSAACLLCLMACGTAPSEPDHAHTLREAIYREDSLAAKERLDSLQQLRKSLQQRADTATQAPASPGL